MSLDDSRTAEQAAADEALSEAFQRVAEAYDFENSDSGHMLAEYLMVGYWASISESIGTYNWTVNGSGLPWHHILGLYKTLGSLIERSQEGDE